MSSCDAGRRLCPSRLALDRRRRFHADGDHSRRPPRQPARADRGQDAEAALWTAELGQPWRHEAAGLRDALIEVGVPVTLHGHRSADPAELRMKAERVVIAGYDYTLYPDRG